ncbi:hypothetical protein HK101_002794 [Irineochytrium annulatum]|nr:hypothetical protein HK101_002794 [Irineochytrium annulatum]
MDPASPATLRNARVVPVSSPDGFEKASTGIATTKTVAPRTPATPATRPSTSSARLRSLSFLRWCGSQVMHYLLTTAEVPLPAEKIGNSSAEKFRSGMLVSDLSILKVKNGPRSSEVKNSPIRKGGGLMPGMGQDEEDDEISPFETKEGLFANTDLDTLKQYLRMTTLQFRSSRMEELYLRTMLLPNRIVQLRVSILFLLLYLIAYFPFLVLDGTIIFTRLVFYVFAVVFCSAFAFLTFNKKGKFFVELFVHSRATRWILLVMELVGLMNSVLFDTFYIGSPPTPIGSTASISIILACLTTGLSATYWERLINVVTIIVICVIKAVIIYLGPFGWQGVVVYTLPIVICVTLVVEMLYKGDLERRIRYLKTQIIASRLKGIQDENKKTEYLLSLTLPWTIVTKLKEVGTGNFDLIAERVPFASVMFADLKNYKEIAASLGSTREAVTLLNSVFHQMDEVRGMYKGLERIKTIHSKVLIVGGLSDSDHLQAMLDMALAFRAVFESPLTYDLNSVSGASAKKLALKLDVAFGIQIGPLVAGIVGRKTFSYEVYGDTVNTSSRMLSLASGGQIIVTQQVWDECRNDFDGNCLGERLVKGKGVISIYSITGRRDPDSHRLSEAHPADTTSLVTGAPAVSAMTAEERRTSYRRRSTLRSVRGETALFRALNKMSNTVALPAQRQIDTEIIHSAMNAQRSPTSVGAPSPTILAARSMSIQDGTLNRGADTLSRTAINNAHATAKRPGSSKEWVNQRMGSPSWKNAPRTGSFASQNTLDEETAKTHGAAEKRSTYLNSPLRTNSEFQGLTPQGTIRGFGKSNLTSLQEVPSVQNLEEGDSPVEENAQPSNNPPHSSTDSNPPAKFSEFTIGADMTDENDDVRSRLRYQSLPNASLLSPTKRADGLDPMSVTVGRKLSNQTLPLPGIPAERQNRGAVRGGDGVKSVLKETHVVIDSEGDYPVRHIASHGTLHDREESRKGSMATTVASQGTRTTMSIRLGSGDLLPVSGTASGRSGGNIAGSSAVGFASPSKGRSLSVASGEAAQAAALEEGYDAYENDEDGDEEKEADYGVPRELDGESDEGKQGSDAESERVIQSLLKTMEARGIETGGADAWKWLNLDGAVGTGSTQNFPRQRITSVVSENGDRPKSGETNTGTDGTRSPSFAAPSINPVKGSSPSLAGAGSGGMLHRNTTLRKRGDGDSDSKENSFLGDLTVIKRSLSYGLRFTNPQLEMRFRRDFNKMTWNAYLRHGMRGILIQLILLVLALLNLNYVMDTGLAQTNVVYIVIGIVFAATGTQMLFTWVNVWGEGTVSPPMRHILALWSVTTIFAMVVLVSHPWDGLIKYTLLTNAILPQVVVIYTLSVDGMDFPWRLGCVSISNITLLGFNIAFSPDVMFTFNAFIPIVTSFVWIFIFSIRETNVRIEYLMDLILVTQSDMVREEILKASRVLETVLPHRVTVKLLSDPTSMVYEDFEMVTVLHMDIAGFTAMSSTMEALTIFKMLNSLFTYFDHLTEEFNVEKITTIGDAYVVSSSLSDKADPKISAISVAIVALQMQSFVVNQMNPSAMMLNLKQKLSMRIGLHTGWAYGAIMGGAKNFRYDLLGDTEKIQEVTPPAAVCISGVTYDLCRDYHGFEILNMNNVMSGQSVYHLKGNRGLIGAVPMDPSQLPQPPFFQQSQQLPPTAYAQGAYGHPPLSPYAVNGIPPPGPAGAGAGAGTDATNSGAESSSAAGKRKRTTKACDTCNKRKVKCDSAQPRCHQCASHDLECTYSREAKKRGPKQGHLRDLESRLRQMEEYIKPADGSPGPEEQSPPKAKGRVKAVPKKTKSGSASSKSDIVAVKPPTGGVGAMGGSTLITSPTNVASRPLHGVQLVTVLPPPSPFGYQPEAYGSVFKANLSSGVGSSRHSVGPDAKMGSTNTFPLFTDEESDGLDVWAIIDRDFDSLMGGGGLNFGAQLADANGGTALTPRQTPGPVSLSDMPNPFGFAFDAFDVTGPSPSPEIALDPSNGMAFGPQPFETPSTGVSPFSQPLPIINQPAPFTSLQTHLQAAHPSPATSSDDPSFHSKALQPSTSAIKPSFADISKASRGATSINAADDADVELLPPLDFPQDCLDQLLDLYFHYANPILGFIVHEGTFRSSGKMVQTPLLLSSMYAMAARFSRHPVIVSKVRASDEGGMYSAVSAASWMYSGMAIRMAQSLKLDLDPDFAEVTSLFGPMSWYDKELRRRLWWVCFIMDRYTASAADRSMLVQEKDARVFPPAPRHIWFSMREGDPEPKEEALGGHSQWQLTMLASTGMYSPELTTAVANEEGNEPGYDGKTDCCFHFYVNMARVFGRVMEYTGMLKTPCPGPSGSALVSLAESEQKLLAIEGALRDWIGSLPDWIRNPGRTFAANWTQVDPATGQLSPPPWEVAFLHIFYNASVVMLHRPKMMAHLQGGNQGGALGCPNFVASVQAATSVATLLEVIMETNPDFFWFTPFVAFCVFQTSLVHVVAAQTLGDQPEQVQQACRRVRTHLRALKSIARYWLQGFRLSVLLQELFQTVEKSVVQHGDGDGMGVLVEGAVDGPLGGEIAA